jgi:hypothetical protein
MKRSRLITNRATDGLGDMIVLTITVLAGAVLFALLGSMLERMREEQPEPDLSLCPFCDQPVQY